VIGFSASSVHFDWITSQEQHIVNDVIKTIKDMDNCGIVIDVGMNRAFTLPLFSSREEEEREENRANARARRRWRRYFRPKRLRR